MIKYGPMIVLGVLLGTLARLSVLRIDYRQYPGYPHGYIVHVTLGFIAASLGGIGNSCFARRKLYSSNFPGGCCSAI